MTRVEAMAQWIAGARFEDLSPAAREALKIRILDALGCALGAQGAPQVERIREQVADFGGRPLCTLIGGGRTAPDRAPLYNGALVRYLDFNDSYLARGETCHPSDNLGAVPAAAEYVGTSGKDFLAALAAAYQVQGRNPFPGRARGGPGTAARTQVQGRSDYRRSDRNLRRGLSHHRGGEEGPKTSVKTKEEADHSLPYLVAVALLDGRVMPAQYRSARIRSTDVQNLLRKVAVYEEPGFSARFPEEMACRITIELSSGQTLTREKQDYEGFRTRPMAWEAAETKFGNLSGAADPSLQGALIAAVRSLEHRPVSELTGLLGRAGTHGDAPRA